jgi:hypothetical protein
MAPCAGAKCKAGGEKTGNLLGAGFNVRVLFQVKLSQCFTCAKAGLKIRITICFGYI